MNKARMSAVIISAAVMGLSSASVLADDYGLGQSYRNGVEGANNSVDSSAQAANNKINDINSKLFGLVDAYAPGSGEPGSGTSTTLSSTPSTGSTTLLAGGKIGVNPYTVNCDTSQFSSAIAESVAKVNYRPSLSSNVCGIGGLSNVDLPSLDTLSGSLKKMFCSAVKMVAEPVVDTANGYIDMAKSTGTTGIDYFNDLSDSVEDLSDIPSAIDNYSASNNSLAPKNSSGGTPGASGAPRNLLTEISWGEVGVTRSMSLNQGDTLSVRFTVPQDAEAVGGNFNIAGAGSRQVTVSPQRGVMANSNASCQVASSANATMRFVTGNPMFGRCSLTPGQTYYLNVRQLNNAGKAAIRLFHN